jgi:hypothetical protein
LSNQGCFQSIDVGFRSVFGRFRFVVRRRQAAGESQVKQQEGFMEKVESVTRAQTKFLRAFAKNPYGPPADAWPSPIILRRWLKRPGFCGAMNSILRALRYQADFELTAAAASGAHVLHGTIQSGDVDAIKKKIESLVQLLRMSHIRQRFAEPLPQPTMRGIDLISWLRVVHPSITVEDALKGLDSLDQDRKPGERGVGYRTWQRTGHPFGPQWKDLDERDAATLARRTTGADDSQDEYPDGRGGGDDDL